MTDPAPRDLLGLTLPYNTDFHLDRQNILIANCLRLLEDLLKHYALLAERMSFKLLRTVVPGLKDLVAGCTRHLPSCKTVHLLTSLSNCARIDQRKNLLRITGILTLSAVRSFLARPGVSQSEIGDIISSLQHISQQVDLIYCQEKGQHKLLFSTFLYLYNYLRKEAVAGKDGRSRLDEMGKKSNLFYLDNLGSIQMILQNKVPYVYLCTETQKRTKKANECFFLGKVDDAIFHWMEDIKREETSDNHSVSSELVLQSLLSRYRLRESLLYLNWLYLRKHKSFTVVAEIFANVLQNYFTGEELFISVF